MRVAVIGAAGQLGSDLVRVLESRGTVIPLSREDLDVIDSRAARRVLEGARADAVINTAALVQVDRCEDEPENSFRVNALGARNVALACRGSGSLMVQVSTDYVFDGRKGRPYIESDPPCPLNTYGITKLAGEYFVRALCPSHLIVRTSGLYGAAGSRGKEGNFVETMIRLGARGQPIRVVDDQVVAPTYARDLAEAIAALLEGPALGIRHLANRGECSWYEFAREIFRLLGTNPDLRPITSRELAARAARPPYSVLRSASAAARLRPWRQALKAYLNEKGHPSAPATTP